MHGGDFRQAGRRQSEEMSISYLRKLLEDDVQNLSRMVAGDRIDASALLGSDTGGTCSGRANAAPVRAATDISDAELDLLLDREKLFEVNEVTGEYVLPPEGDMYDVVVTTGSNLQGVE